jgi:hypothetical protein
MAFQGIYRKGIKLIVVRPIILSSKSRLEIGTIIDPMEGKIRPFQLRILFRKRRLGIKGSDWANEMIKGKDNPNARPETKVIQDAKAKAQAKKAKAKKAEAAAKKKANKKSPAKEADKPNKPKWSNS